MPSLHNSPLLPRLGVCPPPVKVVDNLYDISVQPNELLSITLIGSMLVCSHADSD
jgi:hypothetical protein